MIKAGEINMSIKQIIIAGLTASLLTACSDDKSTELQDSLVSIDSITTSSGFNPDPAAPNLPFPINILFSGTLDLTLNIPLAGDPSDGPKIAMNALDGFSTVAPITSGAFTDALDEASLVDAVRVFEVELFSSAEQPIAGPVSNIVAELVSGTDFVATLSSVDLTSSTIVISPLKPLKPKTSYYVVIDSDLRDAAGNRVAASSAYLISKGFSPIVDEFGVSQSPSLTDEQAVALEPLRVITSTSEATVTADTAISPGVKVADIILSWSFTTQSTTDVLAATRTQNRALTAASGFVSAGDSPGGAAAIKVGSLSVPYYLKTSVAALGSCWNGMGAGGAGTCTDGPHTTQYNPAPDPAAGSTEVIPMMVSIPKPAVYAACPGGVKPAQWPVVIYQHGITTNRTTMLAVADAMAGACMAVVAIDLPMHGITGDETNDTAAFKDLVNGERTFDLDLVTQDVNGNITVPEPDGIIDSSGLHYINLTNLLNTRDNVRQAVSDLFVLVDAIEEGVVTDGSGNTMDPDNIFFLGHSLGAMAGTVFVALEPAVKEAAFAFGGTVFSKIVDGSSSFGPIVAAGLAANGVIKGTPDYESFMGAAQTAFDSGDPVNYAAAAANSTPDRGILFFEIVGGNSSPSDLTVPNRVPDGNDTTGTVPSPLAGTEPQLVLMGLEHVNTTQGPDAGKLKVVTKYISGYHGSLLDPSAHPLADAAVTTEIQTQTANFFGSAGTFLKVTDDTVLLAP